MTTEEAAQLTAIHRHRRQIIYAGKKRAIEVIQCSGEDMNLVLTHGITSPTLSPVTPIAHQAAMPTITHAPIIQRQLISPGMVHLLKTPRKLGTHLPTILGQSEVAYLSSFGNSGKEKD